jgi:hypothetical protein
MHEGCAASDHDGWNLQREIRCRAYQGQQDDDRT